MLSIYESLEIVITLRCNARCLNCIRLCNSEDWTGLDYSGLDMTVEEVESVLDEVRCLHDLSGYAPFGAICLTGGEPLLHPQAELFAGMVAAHVANGAADSWLINTNGTLPVPSWAAGHALHWWDVGAEKAANHVAMLCDPAERGEVMTRATCQHYRKNRIVVTKQGWTRCCASEGYVRLAGASDLILDHLPASIDEWPNMDRICAHCAFASPTAPMERDVGRVVSPVFRRQIEERRAKS